MIDNRLNEEVDIQLSCLKEVVEIMINFSFVDHEWERLEDDLPS